MKRKLIHVMLCCCLVSTFLLTGCSDQFGPEGSSSVSSVEEPGDDGDMAKEDKTLSEEDVERIYAPIFDLYVRGASEKWSESYLDEITVDGEYPIQDAFIIQETTVDEIGYEMRGLDDDGIPELIISVMNEANSGTIYDLYTISDNKPVQLGCSGRRDYFQLNEDNTIIEEIGAKGITDSFHYRLSEGKLEVIDVISSDIDDYEESDGLFWYYGTTDPYDGDTFREERDLSSFKSISEDEASRLLDKRPEHTELNLTPLSQYKGFSGKTETVKTQDVPKLGDLPVYIGMTVNEVKGILGEPDIIENYEGSASMYYNDRNLQLQIDTVEADKLKGDEKILVQDVTDRINLGNGYNTSMSMNELGAQIKKTKKTDLIVDKNAGEEDSYLNASQILLDDYELVYYWPGPDFEEKSCDCSITKQGTWDSIYEDERLEAFYPGVWDIVKYDGESDEYRKVELTVNDYSNNSATFEILFVRLAYSDPITVTLDKNGTGYFESHGYESDVKGSITFRHGLIILDLDETYREYTESENLLDGFEDRYVYSSFNKVD